MNKAIQSKEFESRLPGSTLATASRASMILVGVLAVCVALILSREIAAPVTFAIVIGLTFGPLEDWLERRGIPPLLSAAVVLLLFISVIAGTAFLFLRPVSEWLGRAPLIWSQLRDKLAELGEPLQTLSAVQEQLRSLGTRSSTTAIEVADSPNLMDWMLMVPVIAGGVLIFLASLFFYVATRRQLRHAALSLCANHQLRWRAAHVFGDIERRLSSFIATVTLLNAAVGAALAVFMFMLGMPSPLLWGVVAFVLNYVPYVGQGCMLVALLTAGVAVHDGIFDIIAPLLCYLAIIVAEGQFITPHVLGRRMTINPLLVFLSTAVGLWAWGPIGGVISVPTLLIVQTIYEHVFPSTDRRLKDVEKNLHAAVTQRLSALKPQEAAKSS